MLVLASPPARGAMVALGSGAKFGPAALAPLFATGTGERRWRSALVFGAAFLALSALLVLPFLPDGGLRELYDRTLGYQASRSSPFSVWGQAPSLDFLRPIARAGAIALALGVALWPRRKTPAQVAALAAAVLIAVQLGATHWFYFYVVWFLPLVLVALFVAQRGESSTHALSTSKVIAAGDAVAVAGERQQQRLVEDRVVGVERLSSGGLRVRRVRVDLLAELVIEVELGREHAGPVEVHHGVDVDGPPAVPARIDGLELDDPFGVRHLSAAQEGLVVRSGAGAGGSGHEAGVDARARRSARSRRPRSRSARSFRRRARATPGAAAPPRDPRGRRCGSCRRRSSRGPPSVAASASRRRTRRRARSPRCARPYSREPWRFHRRSSQPRSSRHPSRTRQGRRRASRLPLRPAAWRRLSFAADSLASSCIGLP